jgi:hypothetical protein
MITAERVRGIIAFHARKPADRPAVLHHRLAAASRERHAAAVVGQLAGRQGARRRHAVPRVGAQQLAVDHARSQRARSVAVAWIAPAACIHPAASGAAGLGSPSAKRRVAGRQPRRIRGRHEERPPHPDRPEDPLLKKMHRSSGR